MRPFAAKTAAESADKFHAAEGSASAGEPVRVLYIGGAGRSGSTLLDRALATTTEGFSIGEARLLWESTLTSPAGEQAGLCGCGEQIRECPVWSAAFGTSGLKTVDLPRMAREHQRLNTRYLPLALLPKVRHRHQAGISYYQSTVGAIYQAVRTHTGAPFIIDSSKDPMYLMMLDAIHAIDLRVLHLVRDPNACAYSWTRRRIDPNTNEEMERFHPAHSTAVWTAFNVALMEYGRRNPDRYAVIHYDNLVRDLPATLNAIGQALAVPVNTGLVADGQLPYQVTHTAGGNPNRFSTEPVKLRADTEWQSALSASDRAVVRAIASPARVLLARSARWLSSPDPSG